MARRQRAPASSSHIPHPARAAPAPPTRPARRGLARHPSRHLGFALPRPCGNCSRRHAQPFRLISVSSPHETPPIPRVNVARPSRHFSPGKRGEFSSQMRLVRCSPARLLDAAMSICLSHTTAPGFLAACRDARERSRPARLRAAPAMSPPATTSSPVRCLPTVLDANERAHPRASRQRRTKQRLVGVVPYPHRHSLRARYNVLARMPVIVSPEYSVAQMALASSIPQTALYGCSFVARIAYRLP